MSDLQARVLERLKSYEFTVTQIAKEYKVPYTYILKIARDANILISLSKDDIEVILGTITPKQYRKFQLIPQKKISPIVFQNIFPEKSRAQILLLCETVVSLPFMKRRKRREKDTYPMLEKIRVNQYFNRDVSILVEEGGIKQAVARLSVDRFDAFLSMKLCDLSPEQLKILIPNSTWAEIFLIAGALYHYTSNINWDLPVRDLFMYVKAKKDGSLNVWLVKSEFQRGQVTEGEVDAAGTVQLVPEHAAFLCNDCEFECIILTEESSEELPFNCLYTDEYRPVAWQRGEISQSLSITSACDFCVRKCKYAGRNPSSPLTCLFLDIYIRVPWKRGRI